MTTCYRCGMVTTCRVERCKRCGMAAVTLCRGCERDEPRAVDYQKRDHARRCVNLPGVRWFDA